MWNVFRNTDADRFVPPIAITLLWSLAPFPQKRATICRWDFVFNLPAVQPSCFGKFNRIADRSWPKWTTIIAIESFEYRSPINYLGAWRLSVHILFGWDDVYEGTEKRTHLVYGEFRLTITTSTTSPTANSATSTTGAGAVQTRCRVLRRFIKISNFRSPTWAPPRSSYILHRHTTTPIYIMHTARWAKATRHTIYRVRISIRRIAQVGNLT